MPEEDFKQIDAIKNVKEREKEYRKRLSIQKNNMPLTYAFARFLYSLNQKKNNNEVHFLFKEVINSEYAEEGLKTKAKMKLAQFYMSRGDYHKAEDVLLPVLDEHPDFYKGILIFADLKVKTCEMYTARKLFQHVAESPMNKYRKKAYQSLIELYILEEEYDLALQVIQTSKEDKGASLYENYINYSLARIYRGKKEYKKAKKYLEKTTGLSRNFGMLSLEQVHLYSAINDFEKVEEAKKELKLYRKPEEKIEIESALMLLEANNGNHEEALKHKKKMMKIRSIYRKNQNDHFSW